MEHSFFSGSDNLYKYLLSLGLFLLAAGFYYPMREARDLEIANNDLLGEVSELNLEIKYLRNEINNGKVSIRDSTTYKEFVIHNSLRRLELQKKNEAVKIKKLNLDTRQSYIQTYKAAQWIAVFVGIIAIIFGTFKWIRLRGKEDEIVEQSIKKNKLKRL